MENIKQFNRDEAVIIPLTDSVSPELKSQFKQFHCTDSLLNQFIKRKALKHQQELISTIYLVLYNNNLVGYFSLLADTMRATEYIVHNIRMENNTEPIRRSK